MQCPMDATTSDAAPAIPFHSIAEEPISQPRPLQKQALEQRHCFGNGHPGEFPLSTKPSIALHILSEYELDPRDLAALEVTCTFFSRPANFAPDFALPLPELAAFDMCMKRAMFKSMTAREREMMKQRCGGSWKIVLKYILVGEKNYRREKSQVIAGPGHSIVVASNGDVYSFGSNCWGQLGHGDIENRFQPCLIRSLQGIKIVQAAVGAKRTMLVSDTGSVYAFGKDCFRESYHGGDQGSNITIPKLVESLKDLFVVQAAIGTFFSAVLSREGRVYTISWGREKRLCHNSEPGDVEPRLLGGPLENVLVAQISAGTCFLLMLAHGPRGMSVYSIGCGLGGKLGHGCKNHETSPRLIEHFQVLNLKPMSIAAGTWHAAVLCHDGRVCTWGWGNNGCLGHGGEEYETLPKVVEGLSDVKAVHVMAGEYMTFVVADDGNVYSCGSDEPLNLGLEGDDSIFVPAPVTSLKAINERVLQISTTNFTYYGDVHTLALMESGKLYAFGMGSMGQLGFKLAEEQYKVLTPRRIDIDLS